ncbi:hypothetical protein Naga_102305g1, partial [Nannochloropsis gaditana]
RSKAISIRRPTRASTGRSKPTLVPVTGGRSRPRRMARTLPPWSIRASSGPTRRCACVSGRIRERNTFTQLSAWP